MKDFYTVAENAVKKKKIANPVYGLKNPYIVEGWHMDSNGCIYTYGKDKWGREQTSFPDETIYGK